MYFSENDYVKVFSYCYQKYLKCDFSFDELYRLRNQCDHWSPFSSTSVLLSYFRQQLYLKHTFFLHMILHGMLCNIWLTLTILILAGCVEESIADSLVQTMDEQTIDDTLYEEVRSKIQTFLILQSTAQMLLSDNLNQSPRPQVRSTATRKLPVPLLSSSENSDIVTLGDCKEDEHAGEEEEETAAAAANEEFYLGTPCSSQYTFSAAETGRCPAASPLNSVSKSIPRVATEHWHESPYFSACFLNGHIRFDVQSLETSAEPRELRLPAEESALCWPSSCRWPCCNPSESNDLISVAQNLSAVFTCNSQS